MESIQSGRVSGIVNEQANTRQEGQRRHLGLLDGSSGLDTPQMVNRKRTLTEELEELERTNPAVAEAAQRYDETVSRLLGRTRIDRFKEHRLGNCQPATCPYLHTKEERETDG